MVKLRQEAADDKKEDRVNPTEKEILRETVQPALTSKKINKQNNKNQKEATVTENNDSGHKFTLKGQGKKSTDNSTPKHDSLAAKRTYNEIFEPQKETTFTNKSNKEKT